MLETLSMIFEETPRPLGWPLLSSMMIGRLWGASYRTNPSWNDDYYYYYYYLVVVVVVEEEDYE